MPNARCQCGGRGYRNPPWTQPQEPCHELTWDQGQKREPSVHGRHLSPTNGRPCRMTRGLLTVSWAWYPYDKPWRKGHSAPHPRSSSVGEPCRVPCSRWKARRKSWKPPLTRPWTLSPCPSTRTRGDTSDRGPEQSRSCQCRPSWCPHLPSPSRMQVKAIPTLRGSAAERFVKMSEENLRRRASVDFSKEAANSYAILKKKEGNK